MECEQLAPSGFEGSRHQEGHWAFRWLASGLGLYWAWVFAAFFSGFNWVHPEEAVFDPFLVTVISMASMLAVMFTAAFALGERFSPLSRRASALFPLMGAAGTLLMRASSPDAVCVGAVISGVGSGLLLLGWGQVYGGFDARRIAQCLVGALLASALVFCLVAFAPQPAATATLALLPIASYLCLWFLVKRVDVIPVEDAENAEEGEAGKSIAAYPWRVGAGLVCGGAAIGLTLGEIMGDGELDPMAIGLGISLDHILVAAVLLVLAAVGRARLCDFSRVGVVVVPLVSASVFLGMDSSGALLAVAFVLSRFGFDLMDSLVWVRLPALSRPERRLAVFGFMRLALDGGVFAGMVSARLFAASGFLASVPFALVVVGLLLVMSLSMGAVPSDGGRIRPPSPAPAEGCTSSEDAFRLTCEKVAARYGLTARETTILAYLAKGRTTPYIQKELFISEGTVRTHTKRIYLKTGVHTRQELLTLVEDAASWPDGDDRGRG